MAIGLNKKVLISCLAVTTLVGLAGCGAGSKTAEKTSTKVACDFTKSASGHNGQRLGLQLLGG